MGKEFKSVSLFITVRNLARKIIAYGAPALLMKLGFIVPTENAISDNSIETLDVGYALLTIGTVSYGIEYVIGRGQGYNIGKHI